MTDALLQRAYDNAMIGRQQWREKAEAAERELAMTRSHLTSAIKCLSEIRQCNDEGDAMAAADAWLAAYEKAQGER